MLESSFNEMSYENSLRLSVEFLANPFPYIYIYRYLLISIPLKQSREKAGESNIYKYIRISTVVEMKWNEENLVIPHSSSHIHTYILIYMFPPFIFASITYTHIRDVVIYI